VGGGTYEKKGNYTASVKKRGNIEEIGQKKNMANERSQEKKGAFSRGKEQTTRHFGVYKRHASERYIRSTRAGLKSRPRKQDSRERRMVH